MAKVQAPHLNSEQRTRVLGETPGWVRRFRGDIVVTKRDGHAMTSPDAQEAFAFDMQFLQHVGMFPAAVYGGGPQVSAMLDKLGIETPFREGVRVTIPEMMGIIRMVLTGQIQCRLVSYPNQRDSLAVGIPDEDGTLFNAKRGTGVSEREEEIDLGLVGEIASVDPSAVLELLDVGHIPVISSITIDQNNVRQVLSINADVAASALAVTLGVPGLLMLTDVEGVYLNYPDPDSLLHRTTPSQLWILGDAISSGMIPKVQVCLQAIGGSVDTARMMDGRQVHSVLIEVITDEGTGTMVIPDSVEKDA